MPGQLRSYGIQVLLRGLLPFGPIFVVILKRARDNRRHGKMAAQGCSLKLLTLELSSRESYRLIRMKLHLGPGAVYDSLGADPLMPKSIRIVLYLCDPNYDRIE